MNLINENLSEKYLAELAKSHASEILNLRFFLNKSEDGEKDLKKEIITIKQNNSEEMRRLVDFYNENVRILNNELIDIKNVCNQIKKENSAMKAEIKFLNSNKAKQEVDKNQKNTTCKYCNGSNVAKTNEMKLSWCFDCKKNL